MEGAWVGRVVGQGRSRRGEVGGSVAAVCCAGKHRSSCPSLRPSPLTRIASVKSIQNTSFWCPSPADEYPSSTEIHDRCVAMLARLWHSPSMPEDGIAGDPVGTACIGSSEAIMLGGECVQGVWLVDRGGRGVQDRGHPMQSRHLRCDPAELQRGWHPICNCVETIVWLRCLLTEQR